MSKSQRQRRLTDKQALYARQMAAHGISARAAREAGLPPKYAPRLKQMQHIQAEIERIRTETQAQSALSVSKVIAELGRVAFSNIHDYLDQQTGEISVEKIMSDRQKAAPIVEYSVTTTKAGTTTRLKLADKLGGLDRLARHVGAYEVDNTQKLATPAKLDERQARDLARRVAFMMRSQPALGDSVLDGEFSPVETAQKG